MKDDWNEVDDETFFNQKSDLKIILLGDSAVGKSK
jgi:GTPase SAR1 family protein